MTRMVAVVASVVCAAHALAVAEAAIASLAGATCTDRGFTGLQLCSDCTLLASFVDDKGEEDRERTRARTHNTEGGGPVTNPTDSRF